MESAGAGNEAPTSPARVVVAEDDDDVRTNLCHLFRAMDLDVVGQAADGAEAVRVVLTARPDVVVMDMRMPVMNGLEATAAIKAEAPDVQVVMLTAHDDPAVRNAARTVEAYAFVVKGGPPWLLLDVIARAHDMRLSLLARG